MRNSRIYGLFKGIPGAAFALCALMILSSGADAKTLYVNGKVKASGKGNNWASAFKYLRDALDNSSSGDQIFVAKGVYYPDDGKSGKYGNREYAFEIHGQKIYGGFAGTETKITQRNPAANPTILSGAIWSGDNASDFWSLHIMVVHESSLLDGFTVEDGHANGGHSWNYPNVTEYDRGGACYVKSGKTLTITDCTFQGNRALADGGAIYVEGDKGKVVATNCTFDQNEIRLDYNITTGNSRGGAIRGNVNATNCKFTSNTVSAVNFFEGNESAAFGGAIAGNVKAVKCEFSGNWVKAYNLEAVEPTANGGAVYGNFTGNQCVFKGNEASSTEIKSYSSGGAINGNVVNAFNCTFVENESGVGIEKFDEITPGGGGAVYTAEGESSLANCLFVRNSSEFRGGAVQGGTDRQKDSIRISNCTFIDNKVTSESNGAALSCGGIVRSLNNIMWFTDETEEGWIRDNLIFVCFAGAFRNSDENYPAPSSAAPSLIRGGEEAITKGLIADVYLVSPSILFVDADPMFVNIADPNGADNRWGTADDGLRLQSGSPAIGKALDPRVSGFVDVRPADVADSDQDGNLTEKLPIDLIGVVRVQNGFVEIGAYEFGNLAHVAEISVFADKTSLTDGVTRSFGNVPKRDSKTLTFTIKSVGTNGLQNISATLEGDKQITLEKATYTPLEPGSTAIVTVTFKPKGIGKFSAKLRIFSSDSNESPFDITLTGKGVDKKSKGKSKSKSKSGSKSSEAIAGTFPTSMWSSFSSAAAGDDDAVSGTVSSAGGKFLVLTVAKTPGESVGTVEVSSDLVNWFSGPDHTTILIDDASILKVRDNTPLTGQKRYIRVK